jgi:hypothetical protein
VYDPAGFGVTVAEPLLEPQVGFVFVLVKENVDETLHAPLHEFIVPATFLTQVALPSVCLDDENPLPGACPIYSANPIPKFAGPDKEETKGHDAVPAGILVGFVLMSVSVPHFEASPEFSVQ